MKEFVFICLLVIPNYLFAQVFTDPVECIKKYSEEITKKVKSNETLRCGCFFPADSTLLDVSVKDVSFNSYSYDNIRLIYTGNRSLFASKVKSDSTLYWNLIVDDLWVGYVYYSKAYTGQNRLSFSVIESIDNDSSLVHQFIGPKQRFFLKNNVNWKEKAILTENTYINSSVKYRFYSANDKNEIVELFYDDNSVGAIIYMTNED